MKSLTKLEGINKILKALGESPISAISGNLQPSTKTAIQELDEKVIEELSSKWFFNLTGWETAQPDSSGFIILPQSYLNIYPDRAWAGRVGLRAGKLWDRENNTFVFTEPIRFMARIDMPFEECPFPFQNYVCYLAAQSVALSIGESTGRAKLIEPDLLRATATMQKFDVQFSNLGLGPNRRPRRAASSTSWTGWN